MTAYSDFTDTTDITGAFSNELYGDTTVADGSCCCSTPSEPDAFYAEPAYEAPVTDEVGYAGEDDLTSSWDNGAEPFAPASPEPFASAEPSAVIPSGQPGGPELAPAGPDLAPADLDPAGLDPAVGSIDGDVSWNMTGSGTELYPSVATIGGNDFGGMTIVPGDGAGLPAGPGVQMATLGGPDPYDAITILPGNSGSTGPSPSGFIMGPSNPEASVNILRSLSSVAAGQGALLSQALLHNSIGDIGYHPSLMPVI